MDEPDSPAPRELSAAEAVAREKRRLYTGVVERLYTVRGQMQSLNAALERYLGQAAGDDYRARAVQNFSDTLHSLPPVEHGDE